MPLEKAAQYEQPFEYVKKNVKPVRDKARERRIREKWWLFGRSRPPMRVAIAELTRYIVTPRVAKHRIFVWLDSDTVPDGRLNVIACEDDYFFGVLHSRIHETWALANSARHGIGDDPTYNNRVCFETFPFPGPPAKRSATTPLQRPSPKPPASWSKSGIAGSTPRARRSRNSKSAR